MTKLVRYNPVYDLLRPSTLWNDLGEGMWLPSPLELWSRAWPQWSDWAVGDNLAVDVYETDDAIIVKATLPGVAEENVEIEENEGFLTIRAQSQEEVEYKDKSWIRHERRYGSWQRTLRLPTAVKANKATATLQNGVLTIELPKQEAGKRLVNRIKVGLPKPKLTLPKLSKKEKKVKVKKIA